MMKLCKVTKVKVLVLVLVYVFHFDLFEFSAAILEKGLFFGQNADDSGKSTRVKTGNTRLVGYFV